MEKKEFTEQVMKLITDNPAKFIKIRDTFEEMFGNRDISKPEAISDQEYKRLRLRFQDIDVPFSWCTEADMTMMIIHSRNLQNPRKKVCSVCSDKRIKTALQVSYPDNARRFFIFHF